MELYDLKNRVLEKATTDGRARLVGYHTKTDSIKSRVWKENDDNGDTIDGLGDDGDDNFEDNNSLRRTSGRWIPVIKKQQTVMALYELGGFRFHTILDAVPTNVETEVTDLGEWMSRATPCTKQMTINDATATLEAYLRLIPTMIGRVVTGGGEPPKGPQQSAS